MIALRIGLAASGWPALAATALPEGSPLRATVVCVFLLFCPGAATVRLAQAILGGAGRPMDLLESFVLGAATSLALGALVSEAFFLAQSFTATRAVVTLAAYTSAAALCPVRGSRKERGTWYGFRRNTASSKEPR